MMSMWTLTQNWFTVSILGAVHCVNTTPGLQGRGRRCLAAQMAQYLAHEPQSQLLSVSYDAGCCKVLFKTSFWIPSLDVFSGSSLYSLKWDPSASAISRFQSQVWQGSYHLPGASLASIPKPMAPSAKHTCSQIYTHNLHEHPFGDCFTNSWV